MYLHGDTRSDPAQPGQDIVVDLLYVGEIPMQICYWRYCIDSLERGRVHFELFHIHRVLMYQPTVRRGNRKGLFE